MGYIGCIIVELEIKEQFVNIQLSSNWFIHTFLFQYSEPTFDCLLIGITNFVEEHLTCIIWKM